jgi:ribosome maturation factor RimP
MEIPKSVKEEIEKVVESEGLELVNVELGAHGRNLILRIDIDKEGGVTVDDCALVSNQLSTFLDVDDSIPGEYELQVSSPGLDRKFYRESDYEKFKGRLVRVKTSRAVRGLHVIVGHLLEYDGTRIIVKDPKSKKEPYEIEMGDIKETRLEVEI